MVTEEEERMKDGEDEGVRKDGMVVCEMNE